MKKYIIGMIAMIMIVVASAFALTPKKPAPKVENTYWFLMDASGTHVTNTQVSDPSTLCPKRISPDCARLYNESQTEIAGGVRQVKASQANAQIDFRSKN
jgi:hypothetical protein